MELSSSSVLRSTIFRYLKVEFALINKYIADANIAVFRIVQECLTNIARHANASSVQISVARNKNHELVLQVKDNGVGSDKISHFSGSRLGLRGMRERVQALNGKIDIDTQAGQGFVISVTLPPEAVESGDTPTRKVL